MENTKPNYAPQKKYLAESRKQLRVWVDTNKYETFKNLVAQNETSIYSLINNFIDEYIEKFSK